MTQCTAALLNHQEVQQVKVIFVALPNNNLACHHQLSIVPPSNTLQTLLICTQFQKNPNISSPIINTHQIMSMELDTDVRVKRLEATTNERLPKLDIIDTLL